MEFLPSDDQKMIADTARKVGDRFGLDYWRDLDAKKVFRPNSGALTAKQDCAASRCPKSTEAPGLACWKWL